MTDQPRTLVVIPTYNERDSLRGVVHRILHTSPHVHILVVDDNSPDGTGDIAEALATDPRIHVRHRPHKAGLGTAYVAGFTHGLEAGYDILVECDADGSHRPEELPRLLEELRNGADFALGSRWIMGGRIVGWPWYRQGISRVGTLVARAALDSSLRDLTSGYRAIRTGALRHVPFAALSSEGYAFQVELAWTLERFGSVIAEVPITFVERRAGRSKMSFGIVLEALRVLARWGALRCFAPHRLPRPLPDPPAK